jgi:hypothetical protein
MEEERGRRDIKPGGREEKLRWKKSAYGKGGWAL